MGLNVQGAFEALIDEAHEVLTNNSSDFMRAEFAMASAYMQSEWFEGKKNTIAISEDNMVKIEVIQTKAWLLDIPVNSEGKNMKPSYEVIEQMCIIGAYHKWRKGEKIKVSNALDLHKDNLLSMDKDKVAEVKDAISKDIKAGILQARDFLAIGYIMEEIFLNDLDYQDKIMDANEDRELPTGTVAFDINKGLPIFK